MQTKSLPDAFNNDLELETQIAPEKDSNDAFSDWFNRFRCRNVLSWLNQSQST